MTRDTAVLSTGMEAWSTDRLETELADLEAAIGRLRGLQVERLWEIDHRQTPLADGCRTLSDWIVSRLDVSPETARLLHRLTRADDPVIESALTDGVIGFDRAAELARFDSSDPVGEAAGWDLAGLRRRIAARRRHTRRDERDVHAQRYVAAQTSLDQSRTRMWAELPGTDGTTVIEVLTRRADTFPNLPDGRREPLAARMADALIGVCLDTTNNGSDTGAAATPLVTVFVDAREAAVTNGETGVVLQAGPRVGPQALEAILCDGTVEVTAITTDGRILGIGDRSRTIPPRVRRYVLYRDGTCAADGCGSHYRLQPHHINPRATGADNNPDNLTTLCWFHHHVVIHGHGYRIDPTSPPQRRRFLKPDATNPP